MSAGAASGHDWPLALAIAGVVVAIVLAIVHLATGDDGRQDGMMRAAALVPADALAFVHVSLDRDDRSTADLEAIAERFPSYPALRRSLVRRLTSPDCPRAARALAAARDGAFALFETEAGKGSSLLLLDTGVEHAAADERRCGALYAANIGTSLAIGQRESLAVARRLHAGNGRSLAASRGPRAKLAELPGDTVVDGWLSAAGVRRLLVPRGGVAGIAGTTVDQPGLLGLAFGVQPRPRGLSLALRSALDPREGDRGDAPGRLGGELIDRIPASALAALAVTKLEPSLERLGGSAATGASIPGILAALPDQVLDLFDRPTALFLESPDAGTVMTVVTRTDDPAAASRALASIKGEARRTFSTAVDGDRVIVSTRRSGVAAARGAVDPLSATERWHALFGESVGDDSTSILFLDFSKLLALAEQSGLGDDATFRKVRRDLGLIVAAGARVETSTSQSTVDLSLLIP